MSEELYTVDYAARRLKLHRATILRFIREGRLPAVKVGKSYRILHSDLERLAGSPARPGAPRPAALVTSVVDVAGVDADQARRLASMTTAAVHARPPVGAPLRADVIHDPVESHLKIILMGAPRQTASMLGLLQLWLDD